MSQELLPSHDAWSGVWRNEGWALAALRVRADLLAHVLADAGELVLQTLVSGDSTGFVYTFDGAIRGRVRIRLSTDSGECFNLGA